MHTHNNPRTHRLPHPHAHARVHSTQAHPHARFCTHVGCGYTAPSNACSVPSVAVSRPTITTGGGVVTTRAHVHYVVTEFGIAYLHGKTLRERARALINIAHPDDRTMLEKHAVDVLHLKP